MSWVQIPSPTPTSRKIYVDSAALTHRPSIRLTLGPGDIMLLLSDGAWTPLNLYALQKCVVTAAVKHFSDVPAAILDAAGKTGRADDMTAVAVRLSLFHRQRQ